MLPNSSSFQLLLFVCFVPVWTPQMTRGQRHAWEASAASRLQSSNFKGLVRSIAFFSSCYCNIPGAAVGYISRAIGTRPEYKAVCGTLLPLCVPDAVSEVLLLSSKILGISQTSLFSFLLPRILEQQVCELLKWGTQYYEFRGRVDKHKGWSSISEELHIT